jgi:hypothetical protein
MFARRAFCTAALGGVFTWPTAHAAKVAKVDQAPALLLAREWPAEADPAAEPVGAADAVAAGDGHVYLRFQDGILALVKADPAGYKEVSTFKIPDSDARPSWAHPVILDGKLYLREQDAILCYDITAK